jgi:rhodanese-related sulfurtransferase
VRDEDEAQAGSIPGAINIPFDRLQQRMRDIPKDLTLKTATSCPIRDWKATGYALEPAKAPGAGALR